MPEEKRWYHSLPIIGWFLHRSIAKNINRQLINIEDRFRSYETQIEQDNQNASDFAKTTKDLLATTKILLRSEKLLKSEIHTELSVNIDKLNTKANELFVVTAKQYLTANDSAEPNKRGLSAAQVSRLEALTERIMDKAENLRSDKKVVRNAAYIRERLGGLLLNRVKSKAPSNNSSFRKIDKKQQQNFAWLTVKQKVEKVINIFKKSSSAGQNNSLQQRYDYYQQQINNNIKPALPKFYHATTLNGLKGILEDKVIRSTKRNDRPGVWVSTVPELSDNNEQIHIEAKTAQDAPLVCGVAFTDNIQWQEVASFGKLVMANFLHNPNDRGSNPDRLWMAFNNLPVINNNKDDICLHPHVAFLFFQDMSTYEQFKQENAGKLSKQFFVDLEAKHQVVIGTQALLDERNMLQTETLIPSDLQPTYWEMKVSK